MRILIAVGCNSYSLLNDLAGAEEDAQRIWHSLTGAPVGSYAAAESMLLISPTLDQVRSALRNLPTDEFIDVLTFYFAGHGGVKSGSYYLCVSDSDQRRLSTTAFGLGELLCVITEFKPRQANLIIDACQSGGAMYDFAHVLHEEALEGDSPLAISVLAACGTREGASETPEGGAATIQLLRYLNGDEELQGARPFLDLIEIGRAVSNDLEKQGAQTPVVWGVNLTGAPEFVGNPHFDAGSPV
jgi:hypothetical protein